ncbi:MAG: hypothetical protein WBG50_04530 [Desulfomonilaceae bacterium]
MTEKVNTPLKPRKLQKIDEYRDKIPLAWRFYQREIEKGTDARKAEVKAVKAVYPKDKNSSSTLRTWKNNGLWPCEPQKESTPGNKNGLTVIDGGNAGQRKYGLSDLLKASRSGSSPDSPELSEKEILQSVRKILDKIEVRKKEWTGGTRKKYSTTKTVVFAGRLPVDLINEIHLFKGSNTYHLERALRLYVKAMGAKED